MKKFLSIIITIILTLQSISLCFAEDTHWAKNYADELFEAGIVKGDLDGFRFESLVTRAEFTALINRAFNFTDEDAPDFKDAKESDWYYSELLKARKAGYLKGDSNGNANPESDVFDSLADYIHSGDYVEIKIPWQLLNFADPSKMAIHDDYYSGHYGINYITIDTMYLGLSTVSESRRINLYPFPLEGWGNKVTYHERLKPSYYILQSVWRDT